MTPTRPVPPAQMTAFGRALCEHLGLDPAMVDERTSWYVGDEQGYVDLRIHIPAEDILHMFNTGTVPS